MDSVVCVRVSLCDYVACSWGHNVLQPQTSPLSVVIPGEVGGWKDGVIDQWMEGDGCMDRACVCLSVCLCVCRQVAESSQHLTTTEQRFSPPQLLTEAHHAPTLPRHPVA